MMRNTLPLALLIVLPGWMFAEELATPRPIPLTRPEMKKHIEDMKGRKPRIPLPELTDEEKAKVDDRGVSGGGGYEGRVRTLYGGGTGGGVTGGPRPAEGTRPAGTGFGRENEPGMTLDYKFKTELFWIVSRTNNCQYCLGHQESKLLGAGMVEDQIAALDGDWSEFTPAERAAFRLARKLTLEPHLLSDVDIDRKSASTIPICRFWKWSCRSPGNNQLNRWKEGVGVPQSAGGGNFGRRPAEGTAEIKPEAKPEVHIPISRPPRKSMSRR